MKEIDVSIVIVCMNNYNILKDCLNSIEKYTSNVKYEVLLVAYFFSEENLTALRSEYPWVKVIISDEIRGFSANNNLALKQACGKYCFILNDDTYMEENVVDKLFATIEKNPQITALSPQILRPNKTIQFCGFPPHSWTDWLLILFKLKKELNDAKEEFVREQGLIKTFDLLGAAIFIRTDVLSDMGYLDERYFYGPEDRALTTKLNENGYQCWVDNNIKLVHLGGASGGITTKTVLATRPANRKGWIIYYEGGPARNFIMKCFVWLNSALWVVGWAIKYMFGNKNAKFSLLANINVCKTIFNKETTTEVFKRFYKK